MQPIKNLVVSLSLAGLLAGPAAARPIDLDRLSRELEQVTRPSNVVGFEPRSEAGRKGLEHMLEGRALPYTIPAFLFRQLQGPRTATERWLQEGLLPNPFVQAPRVQTSIGEGVRRDEHGFTLMSRGCLTCHVAPLDGKMVAGLPNAHIDLVPAATIAVALKDLRVFKALEEKGTPRAVFEAAGLDDGGPADAPRAPGSRALGSLRKARALYRYVRDYKVYADTVIVPAYRHSQGRGDNTAAWGASFMTARIEDPARSGIVQRGWSDRKTREDEALVRGVRLPTVEPNPWWNMKFKARGYRFWDAPGHSNLDFNFNFYIPEKHIDGKRTLDAHRAKMRRRAQIMKEALTFARELEPPSLPPAEQEELRARWDEVEEGERLFHGGENSTGRPMGCHRCHGTYRTEGDALVIDYPNRGRIDVGTDPTYTDTFRRFAPLADKLNRTREFYGEDLAPHSYPVDSPGYAPPVLAGVWASAPYFHNGSVPTLAAVLTPPAERPAIWARRLDTLASHDYERLGLGYDEVSPEQLAEFARAARRKPSRSWPAVRYRRVYDTRTFGRSNQGHTFGTDLAPEEKGAILAFLKSLSPMEGRARVVPAP